MSVRLLVLGDTLLDRDVVGRVERVCPDAPVPVVDVTEVRERPGGAGLAALLAAREGVHVMLATGLAGAAGNRARELLRHHVEVHEVRAGTPTICKTRVRAQGQSMLRLDDDGAVLGDTASGARSAAASVDLERLSALLERCDAVLVSDYGGDLTRDPAVRSALTAHVDRVPVVWDPHPRGVEPVAGVAVCTPNGGEARHFVALHDREDRSGDVAVHASTLRQLWQARAVCVTDGERGAATALRDDQVVLTRAVPCPDGTDTCGAGDRFAGSLALALGRGVGTTDAVAEAQQDVGRWLLAGGVGTLRNGGTRATTPPDGPPPHRTQPDSPAAPEEPQRPDTPAPERPGDPDVTPDGPLVLGREHDAAGAAPTSNSVSADELVERVRRRGGTVVATGGCFDVLHAGHLSLLERARALGDCLVVLLNSDASVRRLKGPSRPVHGVADRARLLEGLACVDAVAVFEDDDPIATLARLRPDVWVKGGDYREEDLPEARTVRALGGRIALVPYVAGHSTTQILRHMEENTGRPTRQSTSAAPTAAALTTARPTTEGDT